MTTVCDHHLNSQATTVQAMSLKPIIYFPRNHHDFFIFQTLSMNLPKNDVIEIIKIFNTKIDPAKFPSDMMRGEPSKLDKKRNEE